MNTKTTVIVVVIAIALGAYFLIFERDLLNRGPANEEQTPDASEVSGRPVLGEGKLTADKVQRIRIERPDEPLVVIERADKGWAQIEPVRFPVQSWDIDKIVTDAAGLRYTSKFTPAGKDLSLDQLGLAPPQATLTFVTEGDKTTTFYLGRRAAAGGAYLTLDKPSQGGEVYIVGDGLHASILDKRAQDWRNRTLVTISPGNVRRLKLQREGETVELTQTDGRWVLEQPVTGRADREAAQQLAQVLGQARIAQFVKDKPADLADYGLAEPRIVLNVETTDATPPDPKKEGETPQPKAIMHTLSIGGAATLAEDNYFAMWNDVPVVFTIGKADVQKLQQPVKELRDPRLTPAERTAVREVLLRQPDDRVLHFVKDAGIWKFGDSAPPYGLDGGQVDELLKAILETKATDYITADPAKLGEPLVTVNLAVTGNEQGERLTIYRGEGQTLISVRGNESTGYVVDAKALEPVFKPALAYRDRTILDIDPEDVTELRVTRTGEHAAQYTVTRGDPGAGDWKLDGYDRQAFEALLNRVAPLMADEWVVDPAGTAPEGVTVELTLKEGGKRSFTLDPASRIAAAEGVEGLFKVDEDLAKAATAELRDRVVLKTDLDQIATVKLGDATINRDANGLYKVEDGEGLTEQRAAAIYDELTGLSVRRYLPRESLANLAEPTHRLTVITRGDDKHELSLWSPQATSGKGWVGRVGDGEFFSLDEAAAQKLIGEAPVGEDPSK